MMGALRPSGGAAVMQRRIEPPDSLDFFPTPPWATRAILPFLRELDADLQDREVTDPCCGQGHMAVPLAEAFGAVVASDIFDYGFGAVQDYLAPRAAETDWTFANPPFKVSLEFAERALACSRRGVVFIVRGSWLEGGERRRDLFAPRPPRPILQFSERVPMVKGRWDPDASTATSYAVVIWQQGWDRRPEYDWIAEGASKALTTAADLRDLAVTPAARGAEPLAKWSAKVGRAMWWRFPTDGMPWLGTPSDADWPGDLTHWTPLGTGDLFGGRT
jgi:hypothetical protein